MLISNFDCSQMHNLELRLGDATRLHNLIRTEYVSFFDDAPADWREDNFFSENMPISVTCRYGQNLPVGDLNSTDEEAAQWNQDRNYSKLRTVSFAIASDITYVLYLSSVILW
jgi:hypothetical protein